MIEMGYIEVFNILGRWERVTRWNVVIGGVVVAAYASEKHARDFLATSTGE